MTSSQHLLGIESFQSLTSDFLHKYQQQHFTAEKTINTNVIHLDNAQHATAFLKLHQKYQQTYLDCIKQQQEIQSRIQLLGQMETSQQQFIDQIEDEIEQLITANTEIKEKILRHKQIQQTLLTRTHAIVASIASQQELSESEQQFHQQLLTLKQQQLPEYQQKIQTLQRRVDQAAQISATRRADINRGRLSDSQLSMIQPAIAEQ